MTDAYKGLTVEFGGKVTKLQTALKDVNATARTVQSQLVRVNRQLKFNPNSTVLLAQKQELLGRQITANREKLEKLRSANEQYSQKTGSLTEEQRYGWMEVQRQIVATESVLKGYQRQFIAAGAEIAANNSVLGKAGNFLVGIGDSASRAGEKLSAFGGVMTRGVTTPMALAGAATVKTAVDIDTSLTNVRKTVDGTEADYQKLKSAALDFSKTNAVSASQILDIEALGAQLGFTLDVMSNGKTEIQEFGEVVSGLDIATDMDAETAGTNLAQFANITRMAKEDASNYGSAIVDLGNHLATTESKISDMSMRTAAAGTQIGLTQAQILGWSAAMSSLGIEAEAGGTAFSQFVSSVDAAVAKGGDAVQEYAKVAGMSASDFSAAWQNSSNDTLQAILKGLAASDNMTLSLEAMGVTGVRQSDVMKRLAGNTDLVARSVEIANNGWSENTALSNEVANRNDSLAAKFEMLKNRIIAMADEVGEPLAEALLDVVDVAQPLFEALESGARAFAEMDADEQRAVLTTLALVAAIGPASSMLGGFLQNIGNIGKGMKDLATWFASVDGKIHGVGRGMADAGKHAKIMSVGATAAAKSMSVLRGALTTTGIGLLVVGFGMAVQKLNELNSTATESIHKHEEIRSANARLVSSIDLLDSSSDKAIGALEDYKASASDIRKTTDSATESHKRLADTLEQNTSQASASAGSIDKYVATIEQLNGRTDLTRQQQALFRDAVAKVNEACGTSYEVLTDENGALYTQVDALKRVTEAKKAKLKLDAASSNLQSLYAESQNEQDSIADLEETRDKLLAKNGGKKAKDWSDEDKEAYAETLTALGQQREALNGTNKAIERTETRLGELGAAYEIATQSADTFRQALEAAGSSEESFDSLAASMGISVNDLTDKLNSAGISATDFAKVGADGFKALLDAAGGDLSKVKQQLDQMNAIKIDPKHLHVTDDGTIADEAGRVWDLDAQTIDGKHFTVNDDGTISIAETNVDHLDANTISDKDFVITDGGTADTTEGEVNSVTNAVDGIPKNPTINVSAQTEAAMNALNNIGYKLGSLTANAYKIALNTVVSGAYADGGMSRGTVIKAVAHAQGGINGIVTRPTLTNVGLVGEAGKEAVFGNAIIPLDNRQAVRPFARAVADEMPRQTIDYDAFGSAVAQATARELAGMGIYMDGRATVGAIVGEMDEALGRLQRPGGF